MSDLIEVSAEEMREMTLEQLFELMDRLGLSHEGIETREAAMTRIFTEAARELRH